MLVSNLQDELRRITLKRIAQGDVRGVALARSTGFKEAHISNFLHGHRNVSIEGFDRFLKALSLSVTDLIIDRKSRSAKRGRKTSRSRATGN